MPRRPLRIVAPAVALAAGLVACGGPDTIVRRPEPTAVAPPPATVAPAPTPTPEPTPAPGTNRAPRVSLTGGGACHPRLGRPCTVEFQVEARDPDDDRMTFEWRDCTSGSGFTASCTIERPGEHTATVVVSDVHGARTRASATAEGVNRAPTVRIGTLGRPPDPAPSNAFFAVLGGAEPRDPDDGLPEFSACLATRMITSGPCHGGIALCGGVDNSIDLDLSTLAGPGTCVVELAVTDPWGAVGRDRFSFRVLAP
jgi:hypothetical protein